MALEQSQVNVQELQRLNEAVAVCMDAIRRVVPQLQQLQFVAQPFAAQSQFWGLPQSTQWSGLPFPGVSSVDPYTAAYLHGHIQALRSISPTLGIGVQTGLGTPITAAGPAATMGSIGSQYGMPFGAMPFGFGATPGSLLNFAPRPF